MYIYVKLCIFYDCSNASIYLPKCQHHFIYFPFRRIIIKLELFIKSASQQSQSDKYLTRKCTYMFINILIVNKTTRYLETKLDVHTALFSAKKLARLRVSIYLKF